MYLVQVFGTVHPENWDQAQWEDDLIRPKQSTYPTRSTEQHIYPRTELRIKEMHPIVESVLPQLRK